MNLHKQHSNEKPHYSEVYTRLGFICQKAGEVSACFCACGHSAAGCLGLKKFNSVFSFFIRVAVSEKPKDHNLPIPAAQPVFQTVIFM